MNQVKTVVNAIKHIYDFPTTQSLQVTLTYFCCLL